MEIDIIVLKETAEALSSDFGDLNDLPLELRNTLANIYYKFSVTSKKLKPSLMLDKGFVADSINTLSHFENAKDMIEALREMRRKKDDNYEYALILILDIWKYNIPNAHKKTGLKRAIERRKNKPNEIPNLYKHIEDLYLREIAYNSIEDDSETLDLVGDEQKSNGEKTKKDCQRP